VRFVHQHGGYISAADGREYVAQVYASELDDTRSWEAWCVFFPVKGDRFVATDRETTQSSFDAIRYWASGLTHRYFEGALDRAMDRTEAFARHGADASARAERERMEADAYAAAADEAHARAHEAEVMRRAMRRGIRLG
jgi:hypothetical protein